MKRSMIALLFLAGCTCGSEEERADDTTGAVQAPAAPSDPATTELAAPEPEPEPEPEPDIEVGGLTARQLDDGRVELRGADRWGGRVDTTYESAEYLENALPVLERSITPEQAAALREYVDGLR